jgi:hypothetical protein
MAQQRKSRAGAKKAPVDAKEYLVLLEVEGYSGLFTHREFRYGNHGITHLVDQAGAEAVAERAAREDPTVKRAFVVKAVVMLERESPPIKRTVL